MTFEEWKAKHDDEIVSVATVFFNYERGIDTKTCYDELEWLLRKAFISGQNHCNCIHTDNSKVIELLEKEKCELLGIIQDKDKVIKAMKCCGNCEHFDFTEPNYCHKGVYRERQYVCSKWEFVN